MKFAEKILYCRRKAMMSQEALAERLGVSRQSVSKWETGEAQPEIGKLSLLAQTFGVTADWLLSEDEPEEPAAPQEPPVQAAPAAAYGSGDNAPAAHSWVDDVPGVLGRLLRKYGWLFGVRVAAAGAGFLLFGLVVLLISNTFFNGISGMTSGFGGAGDAVWYDDAGNAVDAKGLFGNSLPGGYASDGFGGFDGGFHSFQSMGRGLFGLFGGAVTAAGAVMLAVGLALAWKLKKLDR